LVAFVCANARSYHAVGFLRAVIAVNMSERERMKVRARIRVYVCVCVSGGEGGDAPL
jgi:hypothetical protein